MSNYAIIENGEVKHFPAGISDLQKKHPNTSFARTVPDEGYPSLGFVPVFIEPQPLYDSTIEECIFEGPFIEGGQWVARWKKQALSAEKVAERLQIEKDKQRFDRNRKLSQSDWTQLPDAPVNASTWAVYRQALRDITEQPGFPWNITWPEEPA